jgi:hypothetical protein
VLWDARSFVECTPSRRSVRIGVAEETVVVADAFWLEPENAEEGMARLAQPTADLAAAR